MLFYPVKMFPHKVKLLKINQQIDNFKFAFKKIFNIAYKIEYISLKEVRSLDVFRYPFLLILK